MDTARKGTSNPAVISVEYDENGEVVRIRDLVNETECCPDDEPDQMHHLSRDKPVNLDLLNIREINAISYRPTVKHGSGANNAKRLSILLPDGRYWP